MSVNGLLSVSGVQLEPKSVLSARTKSVPQGYRMKDYTVPLTLIGILSDGEFHSGEQLNAISWG